MRTDLDEDYCAQCTHKYASNIRHINIWAGSSVASLNGGADQTVCEDALTPNATITIIRRPDSTYPVDITPFYERGGSTGAETSTPVSTATSQPSAASSPVPAPSDPLGNRNETGATYTVQVTVNVSINVSPRSKGGAKRKRNEGAVRGIFIRGMMLRRSVPHERRVARRWYGCNVKGSIKLKFQALYKRSYMIECMPSLAGRIIFASSRHPRCTISSSYFFGTTIITIITNSFWFTMPLIICYTQALHV